MEASRLVDERYSGQGVGGLLTWAVWTVEGLHYLADVDAALPTPPYKHNHEAVDLSHARWATFDAVTAIDLCCAALGRMHRGYPNEKQREMDFGIARNDGELSQLREPAAWINTVLSDDEYEEVRQLRDALVHRTARRHIEVEISSSLTLTGVGGSRVSRVRLHLDKPDDAIAVQNLVVLCRELALRYVRAFLEAVDRL